MVILTASGVFFAFGAFQLQGIISQGETQGQPTSWGEWHTFSHTFSTLDGSKIRIIH